MGAVILGILHLWSWGINKKEGRSRKKRWEEILLQTQMKTTSSREGKQATFLQGSCILKCTGKLRESEFPGRLNCLAFSRADIIRAKVGKDVLDELGK